VGWWPNIRSLVLANAYGRGVDKQWANATVRRGAGSVHVRPFGTRAVADAVHVLDVPSIARAVLDSGELRPAVQTHPTLSFLGSLSLRSFSRSAGVA
jgi:hypothetical protein